MAKPRGSTNKCIARSPEPPAQLQEAFGLSHGFLVREGCGANGVAARFVGKRHQEQVTHRDSTAVPSLAPVPQAGPHTSPPLLNTSGTHLSPRHGALSGLIDFFFPVLSRLHARSCSHSSCTGHRRAIQAWAIN